MDGALVPRLAALVVKQGVSLGGLPEPERELVLAFAALALPAGQDLTEPAVNERLRGALSRSLRFLATDHVELRRWLVDTGHCGRDGYGRAYRRAETGPASERRERLAAALLAACTADTDAVAADPHVGALDPDAWAEAERERVRVAREARRRAHEDAAAARGDGAR